MIIKEQYPNRAKWLKARAKYIGASEIACLFGCGFKNRLELWKEKTGKAKPKDLSNNERVQFGNAAEDALRSIFSIIHTEYEIYFEPFTILRQEGDYSFLSDTPDGWLIEKGTGKKGLYESKTATCFSKADWEEWQNRIPEKYVYQIAQGCYCGEFDFAVVFALILNSGKDAELRAYRFEREQLEPYIEAILSESKEFNEQIKKKKLPSVTLKL